MRDWIGAILCLMLISCAERQPTANEPQSNLPDTLPYPVSNHAVAYLQIDGLAQYHVFNGLTGNKTHTDITKQAHYWHQGQWHAHAVPDPQKPVLASTAVSVGEAIYLFGGYTVAADHSEVSVPSVWRIDGHTQQWEALPPMPTPVDDTVALVYQSRYIYLVSGWHDVDNVDLVQVFDTQTQQWSQATPFPLPPVFGHAGGLVGSDMVICDGVKVQWTGDKKQFLPSPACVLGQIDESDPLTIHWQPIPHHSGVAYYRMAAADDGVSKVVFVGGSDNPYNYNGIGYNQVPSEASADIRRFDLRLGSWAIDQDAVPPTMDHRALLKTPQGFVILGGMTAKQELTDQIISINH